MAARWLVVAIFLAACATSYHPQYGFTGFIRFSYESHDRLLASVRAAPHAEVQDGYDGLYYAQLAVDPLLRDPAIDFALDSPPYRARRILFSWTAYALGLGRPAWILQAYAIQNIVVWLLLAWILGRVIPQTSARAFALWTGCLLAHGLVASVWLALTDGPSLLLVVLAILAVERGRPATATLVLGLAGLARETNLLAVTAFARFAGRRPRTWIRPAVFACASAIPLALWLDYLRSIYRWRTFEGSQYIVTPLQGLLSKLGSTGHEVVAAGFTVPAVKEIVALAAFFAQAGVVGWMFVRQQRSPWLFVAASFLVLALVAKSVVWQGAPGAFTRVTLPMTIGVNVLLSREQQPPWWLIALANISVVATMLEAI
jgi:hypothetical protein